MQTPYDKLSSKQAENGNLSVTEIHRELSGQKQNMWCFLQVKIAIRLAAKCIEKIG